MRNIKYVIFFILFQTSLFAAHADTSVVKNPLKDDSLQFSVKDANQKFDQLNLQLSVQNVNFNNLTAGITLLSDLVTEANRCVTDAQKKLNDIDKLIQVATHAIDSNKSDADLIYLSSERKKFQGRQSQCRLFTIRATDAINAYKNAILQLKQEETLSRGLPIWQLIKAVSLNKDKTLFISMPDFNIPKQLKEPITWGILLSISLICSSFLLFEIYKSRKVRHYFRIKKLKPNHIILLSSCFIMVAIILSLLIFSLQQPLNYILLKHLSNYILVYFLGLIITIFFFKIKIIRATFCWYSLDSDFFKRLALVSYSFIMIFLTGRFLLDNASISNVLRQLIGASFLLILLITAAYFVSYFCTAHRHFKFIKHHHRLIRVCSFLIFFIYSMVNIVGYQTLAFHLSLATISTLGIIFVTSIIMDGLRKFYLLCTQNGSLHPKIVTYFGYRADQTPSEILILITTLQIIVFATALYIISKSFGYATYVIESAYTQFLYGIHMGSFTFYPTRIVMGIIIFCILYLFFRTISTAISREKQFEDEEETQVAIASILSYIGFTLAFISGLLVAGFDFTGLAIIAGALSVGIGLGLQSIVNNFVSGLILLIEKPIKPGDRINVDGVEGVVKKIRVRSTQLRTSAREDIIVPNSDLITRRVTNYMYSDKNLSIHCEVSVPYGTDTGLVKSLLLEATNSHDEIIKSAKNKPSVLFSNFGENVLIFQVWFLIKDGNKKASVKSELNFTIERLFREHNVSLATPQREIHFSLSDISPFFSAKS